MGHTVDAFEPTGQKLPGAHGEGTDKAAAAHTKPAGQGWGSTAPDRNNKAEADAQQELKWVQVTVIKKKKKKSSGSRAKK